MASANKNWGAWATVNLFVPYVNTSYTRDVFNFTVWDGVNGTGLSYQNITTSSFQVRAYNTANNAVVNWMTRGYN